jgi:hypothetical protein
MTKYLSDEEKQIMADLAHHLPTDNVRSFVWDSSDVLGACQEGSEAVTIVRRHVPDNFWLGFRELIKLGLAKDTSPVPLSDEYDQSVEVKRTVLEALLLLIAKLLQTLLCKNSTPDDTKVRMSRHLSLEEGLER